MEYAVSSVSAVSKMLGLASVLFLGRVDAHVSRAFALYSLPTCRAIVVHSSLREHDGLPALKETKYNETQSPVSTLEWGLTQSQELIKAVVEKTNSWPVLQLKEKNGTRILFDLTQPLPDPSDHWVKLDDPFGWRVIYDSNDKDYQLQCTLLLDGSVSFATKASGQDRFVGRDYAGGRSDDDIVISEPDEDIKYQWENLPQTIMYGLTLGDRDLQKPNEVVYRTPGSHEFNEDDMNCDFVTGCHAPGFHTWTYYKDSGKMKTRFKSWIFDYASMKYVQRGHDRAEKGKQSFEENIKAATETIIRDVE